MMRTSLTIQLITQLPLKSIFNNIVSVLLLEKNLKFLHQLIKKLVSITLNTWVDRHTLIRDKTLTKFTGINRPSITVFQASHYVLKLHDFIL